MTIPEAKERRGIPGAPALFLAALALAAFLPPSCRREPDPSGKRRVGPSGGGARLAARADSAPGARLDSAGAVQGAQAGRGRQRARRGPGGKGAAARAAERRRGKAGFGGKWQQPPLPVAVERAYLGSIASTIAATTTLEAEKQAQVLARVAGVIESINCEEGDDVDEGGILATIDNAEYRLAYEQAAANTAGLRDRYERMEKMHAQHLVSTEEFENLRHQLEASEAAEAIAKLNLSYTSVRAPYRGRIVERQVDVGQNVSVGTPLFTIADLSPLLARVHIPAKELRSVKVDQPVELILDSNGKRLQGRIRLVSPVINPQTGTIKVTIEIPGYPADTRPGDFAEARLVTERHDGAVLVPRIALVNDGGERVVFVAGDGVAERRVVEVGFENEESAEILAGVEEGEQVVVRGQRSLKHGAPIKVFGEQAP